MRGHRLLAAILAGALLAAGCGSTVQVGDPAAGTGATGVDLAVGAGQDVGLDPGLGSPGGGAGVAAPVGAPGTAGIAVARPGAGGSGAGTGGGAVAPGPAGPGAGGAGSTSAGGAAGEPAPDGAAAADGRRAVAPGIRGVTDEVIRIGFSYTVNAGAANAAIGAAGVSQGDGRQNIEALVAHVNARGGVAGRQIQLVFHEIDAATTSSGDQLAQEECTRFTQDEEVYAVWLGSRSDVAMACYDQAGVAYLESNGLSAATDSTYQQFRRYTSINGASLSSVGRFLPPGLDALGFLDAGADLPTGGALGLLTFDQPRFVEATERSLLPGLAALGHVPDEVIYLPYASTTGDLGALQAAISSAVLRFQAEGVDRVVVLETSALIAFLFMTTAEAQGYRPAYGLGTGSGGMVLAGLAPAEQLEHAVSVGHVELFDVAADEYVPTPAAERCDAIYAEAGITFADLNARSVGYVHCDAVFGFVEALDAAPGPIDADSPTRGLVAAGGFDSALIGPTTFAADDRDGASRYRGTRFDAACTCFRAATGYQQIP